MSFDRLCAAERWEVPVAGGLVALLDDVAALTKAAAASIDDIGAAAGKAGVKAAGVVVDDTAVTPRYVHGFTPDRELPIIRKIATGSIRNKLLIILPVAMLLSQFLPQALPYLLIAGGLFLCYEGAEKVYEALTGGHPEDDTPAVLSGPEVEKSMVSGAIRTDLILSAEIMVISLASVEDEPFLTRLLVLIVVAILITALVYGAVALIVKMDDVGLSLARRRSSFSRRFGRGLVAAMPKVMTVLTVVGIAAMLWVGGHILLVNVGEAGFHWPADRLHDLEHWFGELVHGGFGGVLSWTAGTVVSALVGLVVGAIIVLIAHLIPKRKKRGSAH
ncbi:ABC transporter [Rhodococcus rhodochrous]|nr:ABC transporter [Rhodococcus rhodochrous]